MKKYLVFIMLLMAPFIGASAQSLIVDSVLKVYRGATPKKKKVLETVMVKMTNTWKKEQVKEICGVQFGEEKEVALDILRRKFGEPRFVTNDYISYDNITYGGIQFGSALFGFQSDGKRSYMNWCNFMGQQHAFENAVYEFDELAEKLKKYDLQEFNILGKKDMYGGVSPLWDGRFRSMKTAFQPALSLTLVNLKDYWYAIVLNYGPFNYVNDEF